MFRIRLLLLALMLLTAADSGLADKPLSGGDLSASIRIAELEQTVSSLQDQLDSLERRSNWLDEPEFISPLPNGRTTFSHGIIYDKGWTFRPIDPASTPYELKVSLHNQFRYTGFATDDRFYVNSAGRSVPTPSRNDFDINRGRLVFSGYAIDARL